MILKRTCVGWLPIALLLSGCPDGSTPVEDSGTEDRASVVDASEDSAVEDTGVAPADTGVQCRAGTSRSCYGGPASAAGVGICTVGTQSSGSSRHWGAGRGWGAPTAAEL